MDDSKSKKSSKSDKESKSNKNTALKQCSIPNGKSNKEAEPKKGSKSILETNDSKSDFKTKASPNTKSNKDPKSKEGYESKKEDDANTDHNSKPSEISSKPSIDFPELHREYKPSRVSRRTRRIKSTSSNKDAASKPDSKSRNESETSDELSKEISSSPTKVKLRGVPSITISEAANSKYRANLLNDIDVAFERKRNTPRSLDVKDSERQRSSSVLNAVKAYEEKLQDLYQHSGSSGNSARISQVYKEWTEVARKPPSTPRTTARKFEGKKWVLSKQLKAPASGEEKEEKDVLSEETKQKLQKIATEILTSEETYVNNLYILDQIFYKRILEASEQKVVPSSVADGIFKHLSAIYLFHSTYLLPQLSDRIKEWDRNPRIGDIMIQAAPFLRMYALYIENNAKAVETIQIWKDKSKEFADIIKKIEGSSECNQLTIESYMLTPVQRTPRYRMLLESYLKKLPETSTQRNEIKSALEFVSFAADHSNNYIKSKEKSLKLIEVYRQLSIVDFHMENCNRELIKEGKVTKIAARNGKKHDRYLYLFDDILLCCKECNPLQKLQGKLYQVSTNFDLCGVTAFNKSKSEEAVFSVQGIEKQNEFLCSSVEVRDSWIFTINKAVEELIEKHNTFRRARSNSCHSLKNGAETLGVESPAPTRSETLLQVPSIRVTFPSEEKLGSRAPQWVKDQDVTMCMRCSLTFHSIMRRRHHCRACGRVVCSSCSRNTLTLAYQPNSEQKVCNACFQSLTPTGTPTTSRKEIKEWHDEEFELENYLHYQEKEGLWIKLWCVIPKKTPQNCICFKAKMDVKPHLLLSFTGCDVTMKQTEKFSLSFEITDVLKQQHVFGSDDSDIIEDWIETIVLNKTKSTNNSIKTKDLT